MLWIGAAFYPACQDVAGVAGVDGLYKFNIAIQQLMLFYNKDIFAKLGIDVPADLTFTQSEFVDVVKKCRAGGYAGVADASGNRAYPGLFPIWAGLTNLEGDHRGSASTTMASRSGTPTRPADPELGRRAVRRRHVAGYLQHHDDR